jgi:hypothetical protein
MGFKCGIIGLPNIGKSTIFNAMTSARAQASNYPFCTIDPNIGVVALRDERLFKLADLVKPERVVPTTVEFVDIAGLVKGASKGEGLGNQFLGHIRAVDALAHIVRCFDDPDVVHVSGGLNPGRDIEIINTELMLADLQSVEKRIKKVAKLARVGNKLAPDALDLYNAVAEELNEGRPVRLMNKEVLENNLLKELNLLTAKPVLYVANINESDLDGESCYVKDIKEIADNEGGEVVVICGKLEAEIAALPVSERNRFLEDLGLTESGLDKLARAGCEILRLITFFTAGKKEARAWTVPEGTKAIRAAGVIHSDFERGFIKAEVISYDDYVALGSERRCKERGLVRVEGRDYIVKDGDIIHFRFNV